MTIGDVVKGIQPSPCADRSLWKAFATDFYEIDDERERKIGKCGVFPEVPGIKKNLST